MFLQEFNKINIIRCHMKELTISTHYVLAVIALCVSLCEDVLIVLQRKQCSLNTNHTADSLDKLISSTM